MSDTESKLTFVSDMCEIIKRRLAQLNPVTDPEDYQHLFGQLVEWERWRVELREGLIDTQSGQQRVSDLRW